VSPLFSLASLSRLTGTYTPKADASSPTTASMMLPSIYTPYSIFSRVMTSNAMPSAANTIPPNRIEILLIAISALGWVTEDILLMTLDLSPGNPTAAVPGPDGSDAVKRILGESRPSQMGLPRHRLGRIVYAIRSARSLRSTAWASRAERRAACLIAC